MFRLFRRILFSTLVCSLVIVNINSGKASSLPYYIPINPPRAHYTIEYSISFDPPKISGTETIRLKNSDNRPLSHFAFDWQIGPGQTITVEADDRPVEWVSDMSQPEMASPIMVRLRQPLKPGEETIFSVSFTDTLKVDSGETEFLFQIWFPRITWGVPHQDDFDVKLNSPDDWTVATSGLFDPSTGYYHAEGVRVFGLYFGKDLLVSERMAGDVLVRAVHTEKARPCVDLILETAVDAINFYRERFGFYPAKNLSIIPGMDFPAGGFPAATNLVGIHGQEQLDQAEELHWKWITAHEIGHQYWYEHIMPKNRHEIGWLCIGMGIYADREYTRARGLPRDKHLNFFERFYNGAREGVDTRANVYQEHIDDFDFDFNNIVVHGKGFSIISTLDQLLGTETFNRIYMRCLKEFGGRRITDHDFQTICEEESHQDLDWFFDQWVRSARYPAYEIISADTNNAGGKIVSNVKVEKIGTLMMPIPVTARFADSSQQTKFTCGLPDVEIVQFESEAPLVEAVLNADSLMALVSPPPSPEEISIRKALARLPAHSDIAEIPQLVDSALKMDIRQTQFWGRLGRQLFDWQMYEPALKVFKRRQALLEDMKSEWVMSACGWQGMILDLIGRREEAIAAYQKALEIQTDRDFAYNGDPVTINTEWLKERLKSPFVRQE